MLRLLILPQAFELPALVRNSQTTRLTQVSTSLPSIFPRTTNHDDTMNQGWFDATTLFGLGTDVPTAIQQGMIALTHHFGNSGGTLIRMTDAMRAFRRDVTRWGLGTERTNRDAIDSAVGTALINGIDVVLNRFGDNANNRAQIIDVFRALEREWETEGAELPATNDYDKDDDHSSWGSLSMGNLGAVFGRTN